MNTVADALVKSTIDEIELIERFYDGFSRGELLDVIPRAKQTLRDACERSNSGYLELANVFQLADYLEFMSKNSERFSDGEIFGQLVEARRELRKLIS